jgi:LacI family transcriptional regulator
MKSVTKRTYPTIRDVARLAGVSPGTVSRVLNASPLVAEATRMRVLQAVSDLDFKPNLIARRLSIRKTLRIAVIVPFFTRPSTVERLDGIVNSLSESQYDVLIHNVRTPQQRDHYLRHVPHREHVDGVIIVSLPPLPEQIDFLAHCGVPVVFLDTHHPELAQFDRVVAQDVAGGRIATQVLIQLGHRRIGFIGDLPTLEFQFTSSSDRAKGYQQALREANLTCTPAYYAEAQHGRMTARSQAREMLSLPEPPTAIFAASDTQAMGALAAARELGLRVPDDLAVIGYDDIEIAEFLGLSTVCQHLYQSGQAATELLLERINDPQHEPRTITQSVEVISRSTTGCLG